MVKAWSDTTEGHSRIVAVLDRDDTTFSGYSSLADITGVSLELVSRASYADKLRDATNRHLGEFDAVACWNDDHLPRTAWESTQIQALEDMGDGIVYGDDLLQGEHLPTAPTISMRIVQALGWICPPTLRHMFIDNFWRELGKALGRLSYQPHVVIEHAHFANGKAPLDATYDLSRDEAMFERDRLAWERYLRYDFFTDVERVRKALA